MRYPVLSSANLKKIGMLLHDHRPGQILNILRYSFHAARGFPTDRLPYQPLWLVLLLTARCNLRCVHCRYHHASTPEYRQSFGDMTMDVFRSILGRFPRAIAIVLSGGEPLLHPSFFEMAHMAHERRLKVHLPTNGLMLPSRVEEFLKAPVELLNVSLYGVDAESFAEATGAEPSVFDEITAAIAELARRRRRGGYPRVLRASFLCSKKSMHQSAAFVRLCEKLGVDQVKLKSSTPFGIPGYDESICLHEGDPEVEEFIAELSRQRFGIPVFLPRLYKKRYETRPCTMPFRALTIDGDGQIGPCCVAGTNPACESIFKQPDIWNGETIRRARRVLLDSSLPLPHLCQHCEEMIGERPHVGG